MFMEIISIFINGKRIRKKKRNTKISLVVTDVWIVDSRQRWKYPGEQSLRSRRRWWYNDRAHTRDMRDEICWRRKGVMVWLVSKWICRQIVCIYMLYAIYRTIVYSYLFFFFFILFSLFYFYFFSILFLSTVVSSTHPLFSHFHFFFYLLFFADSRFTPAALAFFFFLQKARTHTQHYINWSRQADLCSFYLF